MSAHQMLLSDPSSYGSAAMRPHSTPPCIMELLLLLHSRCTGINAVSLPFGSQHVF